MTATGPEAASGGSLPVPRYSSGHDAEHDAEQAKAGRASMGHGRRRPERARTSAGNAAGDRAVSTAVPRRQRVLIPALVLLMELVAVLPAAAQGDGPSPYWYEIEALNPGLPPAAGDLDRETPQQALSGFLESARQEDWQRAAHYLDLGEVDPALQAREGPGLAERLAKVIERKLWLDWGDLSDRPDALNETASGDDPMGGRPRRSQRLGILELGHRPIVIRLDRVKPTDGPPVWAFSRQTVDVVPELYAAHGPGWFERTIPEGWNRPVGDLGLRRWELVALPPLVVATGLVFLLLTRLFGWLAQKAPWEVARDAAAAARMPAAMVVTAGLALLGMGRIITFSGPVTTVARPILLGLMILGLALAVLRAIDAVLDVVTTRYVGDIDDEASKADRHLYTSIYAFRRIVVLIAFVIGLGLLLSQLHLTQTLGVSLLASAGVITVLLGIAGQAVLGNIFSSLQLTLAKPIRIGDSVMFEGRWAYVEAIFYTFVRLRTWDERRFIVPVKYFVSNPFENLSMQDAKMTRTFDLVLDHRADPEELREAYAKMVDQDEDAMPEELSKVLVIDHDHNGQHLRFYATAPDPSAAWDMHARLRETMLGWVRENRPEWWPRERVVEAEGGGDRGGSGSGRSRGGAVGDPGG